MKLVYVAKYLAIIIWISFAILALIHTTSCYANAETGKNNFAVLYPKSSAAYDRIYQTIIQGMKADENIIIHARIFDTNTHVDEIKSWIAENNFEVIFLLGKQGYELSTRLDIAIPIVTGAHNQIGSDHISVSLVADPMLFFTQLKQLNPEINRVFVSYSQAYNGWLIDRAKLSARKNNIELLSHESTTIQEAASTIRQFALQGIAGRDAIWLPIDPVVATSVLLPDLLELAWERHLILFSNNPTDVKDGALFSMFPDYSRIGIQMMEVATQFTRENIKPEMVPSKYLKRAINHRMLMHLGLRKHNIDLNAFDLVYPKRVAQ